MVLYADLIAIPDFATGAMENWGLITFRLTSILYDAKKSSHSNKQWVAVVVAHELAHQVYYTVINKWFVRILCVSRKYPSLPQGRSLEIQA